MLLDSARKHDEPCRRARSMFQIASTRTMLAVGVLGAAIMLWASPANSQTRQRGPVTTHAACMSAYQSALKLEESGHLHDAQKKLIMCGRAACGEFLHSQ